MGSSGGGGGPLSALLAGYFPQAPMNRQSFQPWDMSGLGELTGEQLGIPGGMPSFTGMFPPTPPPMAPPPQQRQGVLDQLGQRPYGAPGRGGGEMLLRGGGIAGRGGR